MERQPGRAAKRRMARAIAGAGRMSLNHLHGESQRRAPVDEGTLRGTSHVEFEADDDGFEGRVVFPEVYAEVQHERTDFHHPIGGEAKFLENPLKENADRYLAAIAAAARRAL